MKLITFSLLGAAISSFVAAQAADASNRFKHQVIDDQIQIGYGLAIADVNGDGKDDILLADKNQVVWYENGDWKKHVIAENLTKEDNVCIAAQDIDGDGKAEVAVGAGWNPGDTVNSGAVFYLAAPEDRTGKWKPVKLHHEPTVHRMWWVKVGEEKFSLVVSPLHGRGNKGGAGEGVRLLEYTVPSRRESGTWKTTVMESTMHMTHNLDPVQFDSDAAHEVLYGGKEAIMVLDKTGDEWSSRKLIGSDVEGFVGAGEVRLGKLGGQKMIASIEPMHGNNAVVYTGHDDHWHRKVLDSNLADGHAVACGDLLGKGSDQVVIGWRGKNKDGKVGIKLFEAKDNQGREWNESWVDDNGMACEDLKVADLDGDGDLDIIAAGRATKNVKVYWNQGK